MGFDIVSRYKHKPVPEVAKNMTTEELRKAGYIMDDKQWLSRILFLEAIAGVPGMVNHECLPIILRVNLNSLLR